MAITAMEVVWAGWVITVLGWFLSPIIRLLLPKILSRLGFDASKKLRELEMHIFPELQQTLLAVDQQRMLGRGKKLKSDVAVLNKMAAMLRNGREDAEDIFDDAQHKIVTRCWHRLYGAAATCIALCNTSCLWIARMVWSGPARLLQCVSAQRSEQPVPVIAGAAASDEPAVAIDIAASNEQAVPVATSNAAILDEPVPVATPSNLSSDEPVPAAAPSDSSCSSFDVFKNRCRSIFDWLVDKYEKACFYRGWSYEVVGMTSYQENASVLDSVLTAISRRNLKKRIEKVESTISEVKKSPLLSVASKSAPNDIANKDTSKKITTPTTPMVFGRGELREYVMKKLYDMPHSHASSLSSSPCYSVIGIYGVAGSGKTTFVQYTRDYIKRECKENFFHTIICIHVSETFSVDDIFHEMLMEVTNNRHSDISRHEELVQKLKESLGGKRFLLILDDLWVKNKNDPQLQELISPLNAGAKGSKILVTARTIDSAGVLGADELIKMPDLDEEQYLSMFMHYALGSTSVAGDEFERVGRVIVEKLHQSPIAAVIVAGQLGAHRDISSWKVAAELDMSNDTMDALWWSYQQLSLDVRRCFEYCNIFPRRFKMKKDDLVRLWIAQGFVQTSCAAEHMEAIAEGYIQELVSFSFLQREETWHDADCFTIHDLMHDLVDMVAGTDYFRIGNAGSHRGECWQDITRDVRHLFVQNYDEELITMKILGLENVRTLIINVVGRDTQVEEKVIDGICKKLPKLRVLAFALSEEYDPINRPNKFFIPESVSQLKYLRYLAFRTGYFCKIALPSTLNKLQHIQLLDFGGGEILEFTFAKLVNLRHIFSSDHVKLAYVGRLSSLQTLPRFEVSNEQGCELKQLSDLNKLRGKLRIGGLENVKSKRKALEANLDTKRLTELTLEWGYPGMRRCNPEVEVNVLEGLLPPAGLQKLELWNLVGCRYPDWMVGKNSGGPKYLQELCIVECRLPVPGSGLAKAFPHLRVLKLYSCSWHALPDNLEQQTSFKELLIYSCKNIQSLPSLPRSVEKFILVGCNDELMESCKTVGHPNWQKIEHIAYKSIG